MANKISELTTISELNDNDLIPIVDVSANTTNKVTFGNLIEEKVGDLTELETTSKDTIVNAINDLASGEIVDSNISEASGYIKYSNGFMLQWKFGSGTGGGTAWTSPIYYSDINMGNWDVPFTTIFNYIPSVASTLYWCTGSEFNNTSAGTIRVFRPNNGTITVYVRAFAFGKWK